MKQIRTLILQNENFVQIARFGIAGVVCVILEFAIFFVLEELMHFNYLTSNFISIVFATLANYIISKKWVFSGGRYSTQTEFTAFVLVSLVAILLNQFFIWIYVESFFIDSKISKLMSICTVVIFNFAAKKYLVFKS
jgi:putative flippase GtrA